MMTRLAILFVPLVFSLQGCGHSESEETEPLPSLEMSWTDRSAHGGDIRGVAWRESNIFATRSGTVFQFDETQSTWVDTGAAGDSLLLNADGYIFTDHGFRLAPGDHQWHALGFESDLWLGENGLTLYGVGASDSALEVSHDHGETWSPLPEAPGPVVSVLEKSGDILVSVGGNDPRLWQLASGTNSWAQLPLQAMGDLAALSDGSLLLVGGESGQNAWWSADGQSWSALGIPEPASFTALVLAGYDAADNPLIAADHYLYRVLPGGAVELLLEHPDSFLIRQARVDATGKYLLAGRNGIWEVSEDDSGATVEQQIGIKGDYVERVFRVGDAMYGAIVPSTGIAFWSQRVDFGNSWDRELFESSIVHDVVELPNGDLLLATSNSAQADSGELFLWRTDGTLERVLTDATPLLSVAVDDQGTWYVASRTGAGADTYHVRYSADAGASWQSAGLDESSSYELASYCGRTYAVSNQGLFELQPGNTNPVNDESLPSGLVGVAANADVMMVHTDSQVWMRQWCNGGYEPVSLPGNYTLLDAAVSFDEIWLLTSSGGLYLPPQPADAGWHVFTDEMPTGNVRDISIGAYGSVWVRIEGQGMYSGSKVFELAD